MKQLIAQASGSGSSENVSAIFGRSSRGPACTQPTGAPSTYAEVAVVDVAAEQVVAHGAMLLRRLGDVLLPRRHPPGRAPALAAVLVAGHQGQEVGFAFLRQRLESQVHAVSMGGSGHPFGGVASPFVEIEVDDRVVKVTNPDRVYFPESGATKLDLVQYYLAVGPGIVNALFERPCMLHRFPKGLAGDKVHQKRLPAGAPPWVDTVRLHFPRWNRTADELCVTELASVIWSVQMSTVEFHPWNSRRDDPEKPDEWRIDLDPGPLSDYAQVRRVAHVVHEVLDELGVVGFPKTTGSKGMHVYVRIRPDHGHKVVRRAALAFAREVERRTPDDVTTQWWRKDRDPHHLFVDYNQNARDHTIAAAYSVRGLPDARVSTPIRWDEVDDADPHDFTIFTVPERFAGRRPARGHRRPRLGHRPAAGVGRP